MVFPIVLDPAPSGVLMGHVYETDTMIPLQATVRVYRTDNGALYNEVICDENGYYEVRYLQAGDYEMVIRGGGIEKMRKDRVRVFEGRRIVLAGANDGQLHAFDGKPSRALPAVEAGRWQRPHSAWLSPQIPFRFAVGPAERPVVGGLGYESGAGDLGRVALEQL